MANVGLIALMLLATACVYDVAGTSSEPPPVAPRGFRFPERAMLWIPRGSGQSQESDTAQELKRIQDQLAATWKNGDCDAWGGFLAAEWSVIHITGAIITKSEALQMCREPRPPIERLGADDISVRSYGDAAIVRGRTTMTTGGAKPETIRLRFTDVFIRRAGRWQAVASHATRLDQ